VAEPGQHDLSAFDNQAAAAKEQSLEIDASTLERFIESQPGVTGTVAVADVENLTEGAGASNGIAFFTAEIDGRAEELVLRYATPTPLIKQKRFSDEFQTMAAAEAAGIPVPSVRWLDSDGAMLGRPSCIVARLHGRSPPPSLFTEGIFAEAAPSDRHAMMLAAATLHGRLKVAAIGPDGVPHLAARGAGEGETAIEREYAWWMEEARLANPSPDKLELLADARDQMLAKQPDAYPERLAHGDAQFANVMYGTDCDVVAMLDWELAYLGHNEADLALLIIFSESLNPADAPLEGVPTESEYVEAFEAASGAPVAALDYFKAFCLMKVSVAMIFGADTMPGADDLFKHYSSAYSSALAEI
jgi:aminoglycoside phosphotransferase (APT) family kinase protein